MLESKDELYSIEELANRSLIERELPRLIDEHKGKYVSVSKGKILGIYGTIEEAFQAMKDMVKEGALHGYVTKIEPKKVLTLEMGMGICDV